MFNFIIPARANAPPALEGSALPPPALGVPDLGFQALLEAAAALAAGGPGAAHPPAARAGESQPTAGHRADAAEGSASDIGKEEEPAVGGGLPDPALAGLAAVYAAAPAVQDDGRGKAEASSPDENGSAPEISASQPAQAREPIPAREPVADRQPAAAYQPGIGQQPATARKPVSSRNRADDAGLATRMNEAPERDAALPAGAGKEKPAVQAEQVVRLETVVGRRENLSGLPRNQEPSGAEKTGQVLGERETRVSGEQDVTREAGEGQARNLSGLPRNQEPSGVEKTGQVLGEGGSRVSGEQDVTREAEEGRRRNLSGLPRNQEPSGAEKTGQVLGERETRVSGRTDGQPGKPEVTAAKVFVQTAAEPASQAAKAEARQAVEPQAQNLPELVPTQNSSGTEKTGTVSGKVEPRGTLANGIQANPAGASAQAGPIQVERQQNSGEHRTVRGARVSLSPEAGQEPAVRQAARKAGAPETSRGELPTFRPELVHPQGSGLAGGEVHPAIGSSRAVGHNVGHDVDEKMIGFVRQVGQRIESLVRSDQTSLEVQLVPEQMGKIDLKLVSSPQGTSVIIQAENASTGWLIEQNLPQLRQSLTEAGVQLSGLSVGGNSTHGPSSQGQPGSSRGMKPGYRSSAGGSARIEAGPKRYEWTDPAGAQRVNYLV